MDSERIFRTQMHLIAQCLFVVFSGLIVDQSRDLTSCSSILVTSPWRQKGMDGKGLKMLVEFSGNATSFPRSVTSTSWSEMILK